VREDRKAGGDSGVFNVPIDVLHTLYEWGIYEPGADASYIYVRIWMPSSTLQP